MKRPFRGPAVVRGPPGRGRGAALRTMPHRARRVGGAGGRSRPLLPPQGLARSSSTPKSWDLLGENPLRQGLLSAEAPHGSKSSCQVRPRLEQDPCSRGGGAARAGCQGAPAWGHTVGRHSPQGHHWLVHRCKRTAQPPGRQAALWGSTGVQAWARAQGPCRAQRPP